MADLAITAANCKQASGTKTTGVSGETVTAGQAVFPDTTSTPANKMMKADANAATAAARRPTGIALHASLADQPLSYQTGGDITIGATVVPATVYILSATPGGIAPVSDLVTGMELSIIGYAKDASTITLLLLNSQVLAP